MCFVYIPTGITFEKNQHKQTYNFSHPCLNAGQVSQTMGQHLGCDNKGVICGPA